MRLPKPKGQWEKMGRPSSVEEGLAEEKKIYLHRLTLRRSSQSHINYKNVASCQNENNTDFLFSVFLLFSVNTFFVYSLFNYKKSSLNSFFNFTKYPAV